jgi:hypothetical protein
MVREQRGSTGRGSRWTLFSFGLTEPHAGTAAISIDEVDTCVLESAPNDLQSRASRARQSCFQLMHCQLAYTSFRCKVLLVPSQETARCPALCRGNHVKTQPIRVC